MHLDESGNFSFSPAGTKYYIFTAAWTYDPAPIANALTTLRFGLLKQGHNLTHFHATEDKQVNRDAVVATLARHRGWHFAAVVVEKAKVNPSIREPYRFYPTFASSVLSFVFKRQVRSDTGTVLVFTDSLPVNKFRDAAEKAIKLSCVRELPPSVRFECFHHPAASNPWIQVADYCTGTPRTTSALPNTAKWSVTDATMPAKTGTSDVPGSCRRTPRQTARDAGVVGYIACHGPQLL